MSTATTVHKGGGIDGDDVTQITLRLRGFKVKRTLNGELLISAYVTTQATQITMQLDAADERILLAGLKT